MTVMIIDNFLPTPTIVKHWATSQEYYNCIQYTEMYKIHTDWPGRRTDNVLDLDYDYANIIFNEIALLTNHHYGIKNISIKSYFQLTTKNDGDSWVHQDNNTAVAGILYLNPNPPANSGTTLYHCNDVAKWESYMSTGEGYNELKKINRLENKNLYEELFTPIDNIGNVFNRLVLYPGTAYHKSNDYFGNDINDGRLTQVFFISNET